MTVEAGTWESNSAQLASYGEDVRGGVGLAIEAANLILLVSDSTFRNNRLWGESVIVGGAVAVQTDSSRMENVVKMTLLDNEFDGNTIGSNGYGACLATVDETESQRALAAPDVIMQRNVFRNSHAGQQTTAHQQAAASD